MRKLVPSGAQWLRELIHAAVKASDDQRYLHRLHCVLLVAEGRSCYEVARWFGEDPRTVERWVHALDARGMEGLREHHAGGRPARLTAEQAQRLVRELQGAPHASGYGRGNWTGKLLTEHLRGRYDVTLSARQSQRLLRRLVRAGRSGPACLALATALAAMVLSEA